MSEKKKRPTDKADEGEVCVGCQLTGKKPACPWCDAKKAPDKLAAFSRAVTLHLAAQDHGTRATIQSTRTVLEELVGYVRHRR